MLMDFSVEIIAHTYYPQVIYWRTCLPCTLYLRELMPVHSDGWHVCRSDSEDLGLDGWSGGSKSGWSSCQCCVGEVLLGKSAHLHGVGVPRDRLGSTPRSMCPYVDVSLQMLSLYLSDCKVKSRACRFIWCLM